MEFRNLRADEIECRVGMVKDNGLQLLLYKDARTDARILDEVFGSFGWQCRFSEHKGTLFCSVGVERKGDDAAWVWKEDAGAPSNMEAQKGEASDAFKRACSKWGIGRELYTAPFIWVPASACSIKPGKNGRSQCYDRFDVRKIEARDGRITALWIENETKHCHAFVMKPDGRG